MGTVRLVRYDQVAPGDVAFDRARSAYGRLVELTTREPIAHCFVYHRPVGVDADGRSRWLIAEMSARHGAVFAERVAEPLAVVRPWRVAAERDRLLQASREVVAGSTAYDWPEIARIAVALASGRVIPRRGSERTICVAHVLRAILAARPDLAAHLPDLGGVVWPARLLDALTLRAEVPAAPTIVASLAAVRTPASQQANDVAA